MVARPKGIAIKKTPSGGAISRGRNTVEVPGAAVQPSLIRNRRVGYGAAPAEHGLRVDLVGDSYVRSDGIWVRVGELALAGRLVFHGAHASPNERVRLVEGRVLHAAILLLPQGGVIPAQTVVEGQLTGDFPTVLDVESIGVGTQPDIRGRGGRYATRRTEKKAGISESAALEVCERLAVLPGIAGLYCRESKLSIGAAVVHALDALKQRCCSQLVSMVSFDPGQVGVKRRLIVVGHGRESERYTRIAARESGSTVPPASDRAVHPSHVGEEVARGERNPIGKQLLLIIRRGRLRIGRVQITRADMQQQRWSECRIQVEPYGLRQGVLRLQGGIRLCEAVVLRREGLVCGIVSRQLHPGTEVLIHLDGWNRGVAEIGVGRGSVVEQANPVCRGNHVLNDLRCRIDPRARNLVARNRAPHDRPIHDIIRGRIENLIDANILPGWIGAVARGKQRGAEIPAALGRARNDADRIGDGGALTELLEAEEKETFVVAVVDLGNIDWPAERETVIVLPERIPDVLPCLRRVPGPPIREGQAGIPVSYTHLTLP